MSSERARIKCKGRFHELREFLYNWALPAVLDNRNRVSEEDLKQIWEVANDEFFGYDRKDPYYGNDRDRLRKPPELNHLSLIPLIEFPVYTVDEGLFRKYSLSMGNGEKIAENIEKMSEQSPDFFRNVLKKESSSVIFPGTNTNFSNYLVSAHVGIGTTVEGGETGGGVVSDSPFLLGVHKLKKGGKNLAAVIGFWAQEDTMLVSQIQSCRNAKLPEEVKFGEGCLYLAEVAARQMGFKEIATYTARGHPIFFEHPDSMGQLEGDFVCLYDSSSKKLGFNGGRHNQSGHSKSLVSHH